MNGKKLNLRRKPIKKPPRKMLLKSSLLGSDSETVKYKRKRQSRKKKEKVSGYQLYLEIMPELYPYRIMELGTYMWPYDYISSTKYLYQGIISAGFFGKKTIMDGYKVTFKDEGLRHQTTDWLGGAHIMKERMPNNIHANSSAQLLEIMHFRPREHPFHVEFVPYINDNRLETYYQILREEIYEFSTSLLLPQCTMFMRRKDVKEWDISHFYCSQEFSEILSYSQEALEKLVVDFNTFDFFAPEESLRLFEQILLLISNTEMNLSDTISLRIRLVDCSGRIIWATIHMCLWIFGEEFISILHLIFTDVIYSNEFIALSSPDIADYIHEKKMTEYKYICVPNRLGEIISQFRSIIKGQEEVERNFLQSITGFNSIYSNSRIQAIEQAEHSGDIYTDSIFPAIAPTIKNIELIPIENGEQTVQIINEVSQNTQEYIGLLGKSEENTHIQNIEYSLPNIEELTYHEEFAIRNLIQKDISYVEEKDFMIDEEDPRDSTEFMDKLIQNEMENNEAFILGEADFSFFTN